MFEKWFEEGYDISDPAYIAWLRINHPEINVSDIVHSNPSIVYSMSLKLVRILMLHLSRQNLPLKVRVQSLS